jgi:hypothetical protein
MDNEKYKRYSLELLAECTNAQLRTLNAVVVDAMRANRAHEILKAKFEFAVGQEVAFISKGVRYVGRLDKIKRTTADVTVNTDNFPMRWKVSLHLLKIV